MKSFLQVLLGILSLAKNMPVGWNGYAKLSPGVTEYDMCAWCPIQGVFTPHVQCSQDRLLSHCDPDWDITATEDE